MRLFNHHFLRILVAMLVAVFVANTVYAGGMMVSASGSMLDMNPAAETHAITADVTTHHCHDQAISDQLDAGHESESHAASHCHDCMACYSFILNRQLDVAAVRSQPVLAVTANVLYLAPITPQPSKPPIL